MKPNRKKQPHLKAKSNMMEIGFGKLPGGSQPASWHITVVGQNRDEQKRYEGTVEHASRPIRGSPASTGRCI